MKRALIILAIFLAGVGLLSYPFVSNYLTQVDGSTAIQEFNEQMEEQGDGEIEQERAMARDYNASLTGQALKDPFVENSGLAQPDNYSDILDFANHMMGYIEIPKIDVYLPIYHGVTDDVLSRGIGHMSQSAFPIGGEGNHAVLTGHTGLPSAKLFTDLTELQEGDVFYIHILDETLAYQVDQIKVVEPENTEDLLPTAEKDYVTLITCTPYGINSHRLLVRGSRIPYVEEEYQEELQSGGMALSQVDLRAVIVGTAAAAILLEIIVVTYLLKKRKRRKQWEKLYRREKGR